MNAIENVLKAKKEQPKKFYNQFAKQKKEIGSSQKPKTNWRKR